MKGKLLLLTLLLGFCGSLQAQDLIVKKSGDVLTVYNIDIAEKWVYYTVDNTADAELKRISREEVFSVKIGEGEMQMLGAAQAAQAPTPEPEAPKEEVAESAPKIIERKTADNNAELIARYNRSHIMGMKKREPNDKKTRNAFALIKVGAGSVLSNEDLEVSFEMMIDNKLWEWVTGYRIYLKNKTDRVIYVDLGNTFRIMNNGASKVYFDGTQVTQTKSGGTGVGVNLGAVAGVAGIGGAVGSLANGVNVGGGRQTSTSQSFGSQRILAIPPMGKVELPPQYRSVRKEVIKDYDSFKIHLPESDYPLRRWQIFNYEEAESPWKNQFVVTYSHEADFKSYANLNFSLYAAQFFAVHTMDLGVSGNFVEGVIGYEEGGIISHILVNNNITEIKDLKYRNDGVVQSQYEYY